MPYSTSRQRLLAGLGDVHRADEAPAVAVDTVVPNSAARSSATSQCIASRSRSPTSVAPIDSRRQAVLAGDPRPRRRGDGGDADLEARVGERAQLAAGVDELVARRLLGDRLVAAQQVHEDRRVLLERLALLGRLDADHRRVGRQARRVRGRA